MINKTIREPYTKFELQQFAEHQLDMRTRPFFCTGQHGKGSCPHKDDIGNHNRTFMPVGKHIVCPCGQEELDQCTIKIDERKKKAK